LIAPASGGVAQERSPSRAVKMPFWLKRLTCERGQPLGVQAVGAARLVAVARERIGRRVRDEREHQRRRRERVNGHFVVPGRRQSEEGGAGRVASR
jgi:hypothetical protein